MNFILLILFSIILTILLFPLLCDTINKDGKRFCKFPKAKGVITTNKGFNINNHTDFGMKRIIYNAKKNTCNPNIPKQWDSVIIIQDGGSVSNVILGVSPDGTSADINCMGSCTLTNVYWENVCWRGASFRVAKNFKKGDKTQYTYTVNGGGALDGFQKIFDQSGPGKTIINNFCSVNNAIGIVSCGDCGNQYRRDITIKNSKFMGPMITIVAVNQKYNDKVTLQNISVYGSKNVSTKVNFACTERCESDSNPWKYSYEPGKAGTSICCKYPASVVKVVN